MAPDPILIRPAEARDAAAIAAILRETGWFDHVNDAPPGEAEARVAAHLALCAAPNHTVLVAEEAGRALAYAAVHWLPYLMLPGPEGYVSELFVREEARGRGLGRRLLAEVRAEAERRGCWKLHLVNGKRRESYARAYYRKCGWEERPDIADFILPLGGVTAP